VSFTTLPVGSYSLVYTNTLGGPISTWPVVSGPVAGMEATRVDHTNSADSGGFYGC